MMGGDINLKSVVGEGSTFTVTIPVKLAPVGGMLVCFGVLGMERTQWTERLRCTLPRRLRSPTFLPFHESSVFLRLFPCAITTDKLESGSDAAAPQSMEGSAGAGQTARDDEGYVTATSVSSSESMSFLVCGREETLPRPRFRSVVHGAPLAAEGGCSVLTTPSRENEH